MIGKVQPIKSVFARPSGPSLALDKKHDNGEKQKQKKRRQKVKPQK